MEKRQFRILYRQFLFRMVDLELLSASAQGDVSRLLGQIASLLIFVSILLCLPALGGKRHGPPDLAMPFYWMMEHFLIATTMLAVGLFAVLSWDSTFPDRRDVLVLGPLPVRARTLFLAKVASVAVALSLTVVSLHLFAGLIWPSHFVAPGSGFFGVFRTIGAYWVTMFSAGAFILFCVLAVQGVAAQILPRRYFLRVSAFLQLAAFCLFLTVYFVEPSLESLKALAAPENQRMLQWLPSYWFLGLFQQLNGSMYSEFVPLAKQAWLGLAIAGCVTAVAYALSYFRTLRKIVEEADITPGVRGFKWLPSFGNSLQTAIVQFSIRTLLRSRQHRVILAFFTGIGFGLLIFALKAPAQQRNLQQAVAPVFFSTLVLMSVMVVGTRVVFSMPWELKANWIFRVTQIRGTPSYLAAIRRPIFVMAVAPVWIGSAILLFSIATQDQALQHLTVLGLFGMTMAYLCLRGFQKIPFTCSYLPGKSYLHMIFFPAMLLLIGISEGVRFEMRALNDPAAFTKMVVVLGVMVAGTRYWMASAANQEDAVVQFEDMAIPAIQSLGLNRDGALKDLRVLPNQPSK